LISNPDLISDLIESTLSFFIASIAFKPKESAILFLIASGVLLGSITFKVTGSRFSIDTHSSLTLVIFTGVVPSERSGRRTGMRSSNVSGLKVHP